MIAPEAIPSGNKFVNNQVTGNTNGLVIKQAKSNLIGGSALSSANVFTGNTNDGISIFGETTFENQITSNYIGVDPANPANARNGNGHNGISVADTSKNYIKNNVIGYNQANGISLFNLLNGDTLDYFVVISGNQIGAVTSGGGTTNAGNVQNGIRIENVRNVFDRVDGTTSSRTPKCYCQQWRRRHLCPRRDHQVDQDH